MSQTKIKKKDPHRKDKIKLKQLKDLSVAETTRALNAASMAIDQLRAENAQLRQFIAMERAQVIHYTEQAVSFCRRENVSPTVTGFLELTEERKQAYLEQAIRELSDAAANVAHVQPPEKPRIVH